MAKGSQASVSKGGQLSGMSDHRKGKEQGKQEKRRSSQLEGKKLCGSCGRRDHGSGLQDRRDASCPAFSVKCHGMGHFTKYCPKGQGRARSKSKGRAKVAVVEEEKKEESSGTVGSMSSPSPDPETQEEMGSLGAVLGRGVE